MKNEICKCIAKSLGNGKEDELMKLIEIPPEEQLGDFALPCFSLAKTMRKNPNVIAKELGEILFKQKQDLGIEKVEVVNGYLNIFMNREAYVRNWISKLSKVDFGVEKTGKGKTICMDYSSPNIAKNFHVGHLRTTIIGNSLYKIYEKLGFKVVRINHLGDWGTQFGKLIVAYKKWSDKDTVKAKGIEELLRIYVKFNQEAEKNPELMDEARDWFIRMEQNDEEAIQIWKWFKEISLKEYARVYDLLGVSFDSFTGESFYRDKVPALVMELKAKNLLKESQGANIIDLSDYDMPPCLITKSDGGSIYHSRDIAAILFRKEMYHFDACIYVTGMEQSLHFKQVFQAIKVMGYDLSDSLVHVPYGLVSLEGEKLSTRSGNIIYAEDILNEAIERAKSSIQIKNPNLPNKDETAKKVGVGSVIFHDLFHQRIKNVDFSWEDVLSFDGTTGPYIQYTYARAKSILKKYKGEIRVEDIDFNILTKDLSYSLVMALSVYEDAIKKAAKLYEPSVIARYLITVATAFNKFYHECPILQADEKIKQARLVLVDLTQSIILDACGLLGMECPQEM